MHEDDSITSAIIKCCYEVHNRLGSGFLEKVYENALAYELKKQGFEVGTQSPISVFYDNQVVGEYYADILVNSRVIVELKTVGNLCPEHSAQLINYLKATGIHTGLLVNFHGPKPEIKRSYR